MPVTPGAAGASFDVLLAFSLDAEANRRVQAGVSTLEAELKRIQEEAKGVGEEYKESGEKVRDESKKTAQALRQEARAIRAEIASMGSDVRNFQIGLLRDISGTISNISRTALITGGAIVGGIFAEVDRYVKTAPDATRETRAWVAATNELGKARARIDQELLRTALPLLQQAARVANQAAGFVEKHPEITSLALKAGTILVGVGVIGSLLSKGIKLVADVKYLGTITTQATAAKMQDLAADKQLAAARMQLGKSGGSVPGAGGAGRLLGDLPIIGPSLVTAFTAWTAIGRGAANFGARAFGTTPEKFWKDLIAEVSESVPFVKRITDQISRLGRASGEAGDGIAEAIGQIRGHANEAQIVEAFASWKEDDRRLIQEAADNRKQILADAEREIADITNRAARERVDINKRFNENRTKIVQDFEQSQREAESQYVEDRARAVEEGNRRLREMEEDHLERLRQLREESSGRIEELTAARDALGIVKEQRRLSEAESEENRSFRLEQARARKETEQRLAELDSQYVAERARRQAQFEQRLAENEAQRAEELARAAEAQQQEIRQAREATAQKLRELQEGLDAERLRRREVFIEQIRDIDDALLGERALRQDYYNKMLSDAQAFFDAYRATLPNASNLQTGTVGGHTGSVHRDTGGYVGRGLFANLSGVPEYVLSGSTTRAAERAIGATLTDQSLSGLFNSLAEMRAAVYNDNRRMEVPLSKDMRAAYEKTAEAAIRRALGVRS